MMNRQKENQLNSKKILKKFIQSTIHIFKVKINKNKYLNTKFERKHSELIIVMQQLLHLKIQKDIIIIRSSHLLKLVKTILKKNIMINFLIFHKKLMN